jgi:hypothetical protein
VARRKFLSWLEHDCNTTVPDLEIRQYTQDARGVHAVRTISAGTELMAIPRKCIITDELALRSEEVTQLLESGEPLASRDLVALTMFMMYDMDSGSSFFKPYYDMLPKDFDNFPIFWSEETLDEMAGSELPKAVRERYNAIRSDYDAMVRAVPDFGHRFSFKKFMWMRTAVGSRNFTIKPDTSIKGVRAARLAMVPLADMLNHLLPRKQTHWTYDSSQDAFTVGSTMELPEGLPVMDSYGKKTTERFVSCVGVGAGIGAAAAGAAAAHTTISMFFTAVWPTFFRSQIPPALWLRRRG